MSTPPEISAGVFPTQEQVGDDPAYPAPWTTSQPLEALRDTDAAIVVCLAPDVCLTPVGSAVVPIPYQVVDYCGHDANYAESVRFRRLKSMVLRSHTTHVHGDKPGTRKGVKSGTVEDICEPIGHAPQVRAEGSPIIRHLDRFWMNSRNTVGEAVFVRDTATYPAPLDDDPVPGSLVLVSGHVRAAPVFRGQMQQSPEAAAAARNVPGISVPDVRPVLRRLGPLGRAITIIESMPTIPAPGTPDARAQGIISSAQGQQTIVSERLVGGQRQIGGQADSIGDLFRGETWRSYGRDVAGLFSRSAWEGKYGMTVGDAERIPLANDILSARAGGRVDFRDLSDADVEAVLEGRLTAREIQARQRNPQQEPEQPRRVPLPVPANGRIEGDEIDCLVGAYEDIEPLCAGQAHHIVPDMSYRLGARPTTAAAMRSTADRIPNAPTFNRGMAICLTPTQHGSGPTGIHGRLNAKFAPIDGSGPNGVAGTAPYGLVLRDSLISLDEVQGLSPDCKARARAMTTGQARSQGLSPAQPARTSRSLPSASAQVVLRRGNY